MKSLEDKKKSFLVPKVNATLYFIHFFDDIPENCLSGIIGLIGNISDQMFKIRIEIDNEYMKQRDIQTCCLHIDADNYKSGCAIVLTSEFWRAIVENHYLVSAIWHEVGFYHMSHYFIHAHKVIIRNTYRIDNFPIELGLKHENVSDLFAAYYSSQEDTENELEWMIERTPDHLGNDSKQTCSILKQREVYLCSISNAEDIPGMISELCGIDSFEMA